jgi:hypothetical protein
MKFIKRFDTYLLENYPLIWLSKLPYVVAGGLLLNLVFFLIGFGLVDLNFLKNDSIGYYYGNSIVVLLHVITAIIAVTFWCFALFKKNAIRHLYPIQKAYFSQLFLHFFIGIFLLMAPYFSFQSGLVTKSNLLYDVNEVKKDFPIINKAMAFLPDGNENYSLPNRSYPKPFPVSYFDLNDLTPNAKELEFHDSIYYPENHIENNDTIDGKIVQFYTLGSKKVKNNCDWEYNDYIARFHHLNKDTTIHFQSLYNYSAEMYDANYFFTRPSYNYESGIEEVEKIAVSPIHQLLNTKDKRGIESAIRAFKELLNTYEITYFIDEHLLTNYLFEHNFHSFNFQLVSQNAWTKQISKNKGLLAYHNGSIANFISLEKQAPFCFSKEKLDNFYDNLRIAQLPLTSDFTIYFVVIISLIIAYVFVLFEFTPFIQFILSIPIFGGLMIVNFMFTFLFAFANATSSVLYLSQYLTVSLAILYLTWISLHNSWNKKFTGILFNMGYFVVPIIPFLLILLLDNLTLYEHHDTCNNWKTEYTFFHYMIENFWIMLSLSAISCISYFKLIRLLYSKPE